jgi:hypothetical protein
MVSKKNIPILFLLALLIFFNNANLFVKASNEVLWKLYDYSNVMNYVFYSGSAFYASFKPKKITSLFKIICAAGFFDAILELLQMLTTGNAYNGWFTIMQNALPFFYICFFLTKELTNKYRISWK